MKILIIANWKENPSSFSQAQTLFSATEKAAKRFRGKLIIAPPVPFLGLLKSRRTELSSQDISLEKEGPHTGDISAHALYSVGARYTLIGHSERRVKGETNAVISKKIERAVKAGLRPILCVGEKEDGTHGEHLAPLRAQIKESLKGVSRSVYKKLIVAYEPLWAIGKDALRSAEPEEVEEAVLFIRKVLAEIVGARQAMKTPILYGGSVDAKNARDFMKSARVEGLLVGRASLSPKIFGTLLSSLS